MRSLTKPTLVLNESRVRRNIERMAARAARFGFFTLAMVPYRLALFPQLRAAWLRLLGARIGRRTILHDVRFFNLYRLILGGVLLLVPTLFGDCLGRA